ncbi:MAG: hypothetical protein ACR2RL_24745 [Gammaproteobacteria bacterium]
MAPHEIRSMSLRGLRELRDAMMSIDYMDRLDTAPPDEKRRSADVLVAVQSAYLRLRNEKLTGVRGALNENSDALAKGQAALERSLQGLDDLHAFLDDASHFLNIVARVVNVIRP